MLFALAYLFLVCSTNALPPSEISKTCLTPNGEVAECIPVRNCTVILEALQNLDEDKLRFARKSRCGQDELPWVCCGTIGEFSTTTTSATSYSSTVKPLITPFDHPKLPDDSICGIQTVGFDRILGGKKTELYEFPWLVALKYQYIGDTEENPSFRCSGTLISKKYVLTAAQCLYILGYQLTEVRLGEWNFTSDPDCNDNGNCTYYKDVPITKTIPHPYYDEETGNNDIAMLELQDKVSFNQYIRPICLPPENLRTPTIGQKFTITGWGVTELGRTSDVKIKAEVPVLNGSSCLLSYPRTSQVTLNQICAGGEEGIDACDGDAGGPIMRYYKHDKYTETQWYQEGIIYRGQGCGIRGKPALYTRVNRYISWIVNNL